MESLSVRVDRYLRQAEPDGTGCLLSPMAKDLKGYPVAKFNGRMTHIGRLVLARWCGAPEAGQMMLHECHHPACINPLHLRWGSAKQNARERALAGRTRGQKIFVPDVRRIRERLKNGESVRRIASDYGVDRKRIRRIRDGTSWSYLD